jgi:hypothetical protein
MSITAPAPPAPQAPRRPLTPGPGKRRRGAAIPLAIGGVLFLLTVVPVVLIAGAGNPPQCGATAGSSSGVSTGPAGASTGGLNAAAGKMVTHAEYDAGWRGDDLVEMAAVSFAESSWIPTNGNGTYFGLWATSPSQFQAIDPGGSISDPDDAAKVALAQWLEHLKTTPEGVAGGPDPSPGPFTDKAPIINDADTVDGGLPLNIPEEPWQDWPPSLSNNGYQQAVAYINANISKWGLPADWATDTTKGVPHPGGPTSGTGNTLDETPQPSSGSCGGEAAGPLQLTPGQTAQINPKTGNASAPADAPQPVKLAIAAANSIDAKPYSAAGIGGEGDGVAVHYGPLSTPWPAYDCSGSSSYVLYKAGLFSVNAEDSSEMETYGSPGPGKWITVYANDGHVFLAIAGRAFDTADFGGPDVPDHPYYYGPRWRYSPTANLNDDTGGYVVRHPTGAWNEPS